MLYEAQEVYNKLQDEISRVLFTARINYSATGNAKYILDIPMEYRNLSADIEQFAKAVNNMNHNGVAIFGAGNNGIAIARYFSKINYITFIDNYKKDKIEPITGLPCVNLDEYIKKYGKRENCIIISMSNREDIEMVRKQLIDAGIPQDKIVEMISDWRNNSSQYFDFFAPRLNEVFVDCGCYDGATAYRFAAWCGKTGYEKIYSFEPDLKSYEKCKKLLEGLHDCVLYPYGVSDSHKNVYFQTSGNEDARIVSNEGGGAEANIGKIEAIALDDIIGDNRVTYIKMDIEGAEYDALVGAEKIIRTQKPRLAISIYHNSEHIVSIPKLLLSYRPDYRFWIRHYSLMPNETILYAE